MEKTKRILTQHLQKTDSTENWSKATSFTPAKGQIIIYQDSDKPTKYKVGDGKTLLKDLKFISGVVTNSTKEIEAHQYRELLATIDDDNTTVTLEGDYFAEDFDGLYIGIPGQAPIGQTPTHIIDGDADDSYGHYFEITDDGKFEIDYDIGPSGEVILTISCIESPVPYGGIIGVYQYYEKETIQEVDEKVVDTLVPGSGIDIVNTNGKATVTANLELSTQGRNSKYNIYHSGWHRILNAIRGSNGTITIALGQANKNSSGLSMQNIAFDFTGFVDYPEFDNDGTVLDINKKYGDPKLILKYNNIFGQNHIMANQDCIKITKIRIGYPDVYQYDYARTGGNYPWNDVPFNTPVNCYVDVFIDVPACLEGKSNSINQINVNYVGFANSHKTFAIDTETLVPEIEGKDNTTTVDGEALKYYTVDVSDMETYQTNKEVTAKNIFIEGTNYSTIEYLNSFSQAQSIEGSDINQLQYIPRYNLLKYGGKKLSDQKSFLVTEAGSGRTATLIFHPEGYYTLDCPDNANFQWAGPVPNAQAQSPDCIEQNNLTHLFCSVICGKDATNYGAYSEESDIYATSLILEPGSYYLCGGVRLLAKDLKGTSINTAGTNGAWRTTSLSQPVTFTVPNTVGGAYIAGVRLFPYYKTTDNSKDFIPLLIKREGIFSELVSSTFDSSKKTVTFYRDSAKTDEIITLPISSLQPQLESELTAQDPIDALKDSRVLKALYKPHDNDITLQSNAYMTVNTFRSDITIGTKVKNEILPIIVSEEQPELSNDCYWVNPKETDIKIEEALTDYYTSTEIDSLITNINSELLSVKEQSAECADTVGILNKEVTEKVSPMSDFIIDRGFENNWAYEKWNSGFFKAYKNVSDTRQNLLASPSLFEDVGENDFVYNKYTGISRITILNDEERKSARAPLSKTVTAGSLVTITLDIVDIGPGIKLEETPDGSPPLVLRGYVCSVDEWGHTNWESQQYVFFGNESTTTGHFSKTITLQNDINAFRFYIYYANETYGPEAYIDIKNIIIEEGNSNSIEAGSLPSFTDLIHSKTNNELYTNVTPTYGTFEITAVMYDLDFGTNNVWVHTRNRDDAVGFDIEVKGWWM